MPRILKLGHVPTASTPEPTTSTGAKEAELIPETRDAILDVTAQRLRVLWELKKSVPHGGHGGHCHHCGHSGHPGPGGHCGHCGHAHPMPPPHAHKPPPGLEDLLVDAARLSVRNADEWVRLGNKHFAEIVALLRALSGTSAPTPAPNATIALVIEGRFNHVASSKPFCIQNPFRDAVDVVFTHPSFWARVGHAPPPPIDKQFTAAVTLTRLKNDGQHWVPDTTKPSPVPGEPFRIAAVEEVHLTMNVSLALPFNATQGVFAGEGRLLSDRRLGGIIAIDTKVNP